MSAPAVTATSTSVSDAAWKAISEGMVDTIGGMQAAISYAAGRADLRTGEYDVRVLPPPKTIADYLSGATGADFQGASPFAPKIEILRSIDCSRWALCGSTWVRVSSLGSFSPIRRETSSA